MKMKAPRNIDLTTGPLAGHFRMLAIPAAIGMVFNTAYNMVDIYFAGLLRTEAQAGLAIGFMVFFVYIAFGFGLNAGVSALVGGALGARDRRKARRLCAQSLAFSALLSVLLMVVAALCNPILIGLISEPGAYRDAANRYLLWLLPAIPGFVIAHTCNGALQAQGDSLSLTRALIAAFFANLVLNPLFIFGLPGIWDGIGFNGLAASTVVSQTGVMVFMLWRLWGSDAASGWRRGHFRPRAAAFRDLAAQMLPNSFSMQIMILAGFAVQFALKGFGGHAVAAYGIGLRIEQMLLLPILGVASSLLPIAAQNFGAGDFDRVRGAFLFAVKVSLGFMALTCPMLWFAAAPAMRFFSDDPEVVAAGVSYLHVDGFLLPVYSMLFIVNSLLQALKRPIWVLWISVYRQGFGVAFFIWLYLTLFGHDLWLVWIGIGTSVVSGLVLSLWIAAHVARREIGGLLSGAPVERGAV